MSQHTSNEIIQFGINEPYALSQREPTNDELKWCVT